MHYVGSQKFKTIEWTDWTVMLSSAGLLWDDLSGIRPHKVNHCLYSW